MGRNEGGRGRIQCEDCVRGKEIVLGWYITKCIRISLTVDRENSVRRNAFRRKREDTLKRNLRERNARDMPDDEENLASRSPHIGLKASTETLVFC